MEASRENTATCNNRFKECDLCSVDDDKILVSVSPRRFTLPPPRDRKAKMEIRNNNPYPIYFRAGTTNMDAFRAQPNTGRVPPNSKVSVVVQFFNPVTPIRRHEEVIVMASPRPFDQYTLYDCSVCRYCCESFEASKHHHQVKCGCSSQHFVEAGQCQSCSAKKTTLFEDSMEFKDDSKGVTIKGSSPRESKYLPPPVKIQTATEDISCIPRQIPVVLPTSRSSGEQSDIRNQDICIKNSVSGNNGSLELKKICTCDRDSSYNRNFESRGDKLVKKTVKEATQETVHVKRRLSNPSPHLKKWLYHFSVSDSNEDIVKLEPKKRVGSAEDSKAKVKVPTHILTRIIKANDAPDSSDTELSEMSSKNDKAFVCSPQHFMEARQCQSCSSEKTTSLEDSEFKDDSKGFSIKESSSRENKYLPQSIKSQTAAEDISCVPKQIPVVLPTSKSSGEQSELRNQDICIRNSVSGNNGSLEEISARGRSCNIVKVEHEKSLGAAEDSKDKVKAPPHILTRVMKANCSPDSSGTDLLEMSIKNDKAFTKWRIISEDDFKKKLEKAEFRKHQIRLEEESQSTTATAATAESDQLKEENQVLVTPKILQQKLDSILNLTWINFYLLLAFIALLVGLDIVDYKFY